MAARFNRVAIGALLIKEGVKCRTRNVRGFTPFHFACSEGFFEFAELLLNAIKGEEHEVWE